jgi:hypothetical protein
MSNRLVRRLCWSLLCCAIIGIGLFTGSVRSQDAATEAANAPLQAVGGLGVGHIQSSLGLIGVTADAFAKDVYTARQVEDLMNGTINGIEAVKKLLRKLQDAKLTDDDEEYIDRMVTVFNALQREAKALITYAKSRKPADAEVFDAARKSALTKLNQLTEGSPVTPEPDGDTKSDDNAKVE